MASSPAPAQELKCRHSCLVAIVAVRHGQQCNGCIVQGGSSKEDRGGDLIRVSVLFVLRGFKLVRLLMQLRSRQCHCHGQQRPTSCPQEVMSNCARDPNAATPTSSLMFLHMQQTGGSPVEMAAGKRIGGICHVHDNMRMILLVHILFSKPKCSYNLLPVAAAELFRLQMPHWYAVTLCTRCKPRECDILKSARARSITQHRQSQRRTKME